MTRIALALGTALLLAVTACGGAPPRPTNTSGGTVEIAGRVVSCLRKHGAPNYPEIAVGADGLPRTDNLPPAPAAAAGACRTIITRMAARITQVQSLVGAELRPLDPFRSVLAEARRHRLVALGDFHLNQEFHDFVQALLIQPDFPARFDDIVVEFGNARNQPLADRFLLQLQPVAKTKLSDIWRDATFGGRVYWDAPVYEQFFRTVRAVNWRLPRDQRIRVLLGDPPVDWARVRSASELPAAGARERFFAGVVERSVLARGRRALLIIGGDHLRRGVHANDDPSQPNVGTLLAQRHHSELFVIEPLPVDQPDSPVSEKELEAHLRSWPRPSLALLRDTGLGAQRAPYRAFRADSTYRDQFDAVLWLGPEAQLTASQADWTIYRTGAYALELRRRSRILSELPGQRGDLVAEGLQLSTAGPGASEGRNALGGSRKEQHSEEGRGTCIETFGQLAWTAEGDVVTAGA
jgi:hypothetical protein